LLDALVADPESLGHLAKRRTGQVQPANVRMVIGPSELHAAFRFGQLGSGFARSLQQLAFEGHHHLSVYRQ